jgi:hypothetical protein
MSYYIIIRQPNAQAVSPDPLVISRLTIPDYRYMNTGREGNGFFRRQAMGKEWLETSGISG